MKRIAFLVIISAIILSGMNIQADDWSSSPMYQPSTKENVNPLYESGVTGYATTGGITGYMPTRKENRPQQGQDWQSSSMYQPQTKERMNPLYEAPSNR